MDWLVSGFDAVLFTGGRNKQGDSGRSGLRHRLTPAVSVAHICNSRQMTRRSASTGVTRRSAGGTDSRISHASRCSPRVMSPSAVSTGRAVVIMPTFTRMRARVPGEIGREDAPPAGKGGRSPCVPGRLPLGKVVGLARFELTTSCTPCKRSTKLSYSPRRSGPQQKVDMNEVEADCKPWISGKMRSGGKGLPLTRWRDDGIGGNEVA